MNQREDFSEDDDLFTEEAFIEMVESRMVTNRDGTGYYSDGEESMWRDALAIPSKILRDGFDQHYTHVVWFNK